MKKSLLLGFLIIILISSCSKKSLFIEDEKGHKQYKNENGNFVKDSWVEIDGDKYYFDLNGYLVTEKWVQDEYYVDENGKMLHDYWYDDGNGQQYYLTSDGKYAKSCVLSIDNKEFAFDNNGNRAKNLVVKDGEKAYYFGSDYLKDVSEGWKNSNGNYNYVNSEGNAIVNNWAKIEGKWYHFDENGVLQKNTFVEDFYVDENGEMVVNKTIFINGSNYKFNSEGKSEIVQPKKLNLQEIVNRCCYFVYNGEREQQTWIKVINDGKTIRIPHLDSSLESVERIFKELGVPLSIKKKMELYKASEGYRSEKYNNITIDWWGEKDLFSNFMNFFAEITVD